MKNETLTNHYDDTDFKQINTLLGEAENLILSKEQCRPEKPVIMVFGAPGSGSEIVYNWLALSGLFTFPTQFLTNLNLAPYTGLHLQNVLETHLTKNTNENGDDALFSPAEFDPFWNRFFSVSTAELLTVDETEIVDTESLLTELGLMEAASNKPLLFHMPAWAEAAPFLNKIIPGVIAVVVKRKPLGNLQEILLQRRTLPKNKRYKYGFKPKQLQQMKGLSVYKHIAAQYHYTNLTLLRDIAQISSSKKVVVNFESFCSKPIKVWRAINNRFNRNGFSFHQQYDGKPIIPSDSKKLTPLQTNRLIAAYYSLFGKDISTRNLKV